jgi:hypothetical protein
MHGTITKAQISRIWACANELGLDEEMLYLLVPRGSISAMSREEASELIQSLEQLKAKEPGPAEQGQPQRPEPAADPHAVTAEQKSFIYFLLGKLRWVDQPERMRGFLRKYAHVSSVEEIRDRKRASAIIEALKAIHKREASRKAWKAGQ